MRFHTRRGLVVLVMVLIATYYRVEAGRFLSLSAVQAHQARIKARRAASPLLAALIFLPLFGVVEDFFPRLASPEVSL